MSTTFVPPKPSDWEGPAGAFVPPKPSDWEGPAKAHVYDIATRGFKLKGKKEDLGPAGMPVDGGADWQAEQAARMLGHLGTAMAPAVVGPIMAAPVTSALRAITGMGVGSGVNSLMESLGLPGFGHLLGEVGGVTSAGLVPELTGVSPRTGAGIRGLATNTLGKTLRKFPGLSILTDAVDAYKEGTAAFDKTTGVAESAKAKSELTGANRPTGLGFEPGPFANPVRAPLADTTPTLPESPSLRSPVRPPVVLPLSVVPADAATLADTGLGLPGFPLRPPTVPYGTPVGEPVTAGGISAQPIQPITIDPTGLGGGGPLRPLALTSTVSTRLPASTAGIVAQPPQPFTVDLEPYGRYNGPTHPPLSPTAPTLPAVHTVPQPVNPEFPLRPPLKPPVGSIPESAVPPVPTELDAISTGARDPKLLRTLKEFLKANPGASAQEAGAHLKATLGKPGEGYSLGAYTDYAHNNGASRIAPAGAPPSNLGLSGTDPRFHVEGSASHDVLKASGQKYGVNIPNYLESTGMTPDEFRKLEGNQVELNKIAVAGHPKSKRQSVPFNPVQFQNVLNSWLHLRGEN